MNRSADDRGRTGFAATAKARFRGGSRSGLRWPAGQPFRKAYREDVNVPFGIASMLIQGAVYSLAYPRLFAADRSRWLRDGLLFGLGAGALAWSFSVLAVAAKHPMSSVPGYVAIETAFFALSYLITGPLIALVHRPVATIVRTTTA